MSFIKKEFQEPFTNIALQSNKNSSSSKQQHSISSILGVNSNKTNGSNVKANLPKSSAASNSNHMK
jgi:hypothetical protein